MVQITVSNNIRIRGANTPLRAAITKALTVDNPEYKKRRARRRPTWGVDPKLKMYGTEGTDLIVPRGFEDNIFPLLIACGIKDNIQWERLQVEGKEMDPMEGWSDAYQLTMEQMKVSDAIYPHNGVLVAPAGAGKTILGLNYIYRSMRAALWITHTKDLLEQTAKRAKQCMPDIGEVGKLAEGVVNWGSGKLIVATIQTLQSNPKLIEQLNQFIGTVVVDECHHLPAACFMDVVGQLKARNMLGLTATTDRKDGLECYMYAGLGPKLYEIDRAGLYDTGRLIKPEIKFVYTEFNFEQASVRNSINSVDAGGEQLDYRELLDKLIADEDRLKLIARNIVEKAGYQLVISDSIPYCHFLYNEIVQICTNLQIPVPRMKVVHGQLQRWGWKVIKSEFAGLQMMQDGLANAVKYDKAAKRWKAQVKNYSDEQYRDWNISTAERKQTMLDASNRKIDILIATGQLVQEGLDLPHLNHGHLVTPKNGDTFGAENGAAVEQAIGRIMRVDPLVPNKVAIWWDYVDYNNGVFRTQYQNRRKVYARLQLKLQAKSKTKGKDLEKFLRDMAW